MQHHQEMAFTRRSGGGPRWRLGMSLSRALTLSAALSAEGRSPPCACCISMNVSSVLSLASLLRPPPALRSRSCVQTFLPSFTVNSFRNDSHLTHRPLHSGSHAAAPSASLTSPSLSAMLKSPIPTSSLGFRVVRCFGWSAAWKVRRWILLFDM